MSETKKCKHCQTDIPKKAKVCPNCKRKQGGKLKTVLLVILVLGIIGSFMPDEETEVTENKAKENTVDNIEVKEDIDIVEESKNDIDDNITIGQKNALATAKSYLDFKGFSYEGLKEQLEYEKYEQDDIIYAVDNCGADWNQEALESAESYLDFQAFSYDGLIEQLEYEKFTKEQAIYGADNCGADWNEQAVKCAENYLDFQSFSKESLIDQLIYEGFTEEQAIYGVEKIGY